MCRGKTQCDELGIDISVWSKEAPLQPPTWFSDQIAIFEKAFKLAAQGDINKSIEVLKTIRNTDLQDWYIEHGQISGKFRNKILQIPSNKSKDIICDLLRSPEKYAEEVFKRDNYTCQYCGGKVVSKKILKKYEDLVGSDHFRSTGTNRQRHGIVLSSRANADHIIPWNLGGKTNLDNLITSCWSCNYGKSGYTLEQLKLDNPKNNNYTNKNWFGLMNYLK